MIDWSPSGYDYELMADQDQTQMYPSNSNSAATAATLIDDTTTVLAAELIEGADEAQIRQKHLLVEHIKRILNGLCGSFARLSELVRNTSTCLIVLCCHVLHYCKLKLLLTCTYLFNMFRNFNPNLKIDSTEAHRRTESTLRKI